MLAYAAAVVIMLTLALQAGAMGDSLIKRGGSPSPNQLILVHPTDNLSAVVAYATAGDVLLLADGVYRPGVTIMIDKNITIAAQVTGHAVIDGQGKHRVLQIGKGKVVLTGLNITGGDDDHGGGVLIEGSGIEVVFTNCDIYNNTADSYYGGGGVYIEGGDATFTTCNIYENTASYGGGVYVYSGTVTFTDCDIYENKAAFGGGVCISGAEVTFTNCNIYSNTATAYSGGVHINDGTFTFTNCNIYQNTATYDGGGVHINDGTTNFTNCSITSNTAGGHGGGIYLDKDAPQPPKLDSKSILKSNTPDNCYGFWSSPACFGDLPTLATNQPPMHLVPAA